jgi:hypothetical protein
MAGVALYAQDAPSPSPEAQATVNVSQVRIVRLSQVKGQVQLDRGNGRDNDRGKDQKFEEAFLNLPIVAGERLRTQVGLAEVEFEDNTSIRLAPSSLVDFGVLERDVSGATNSSVKLVSGSLYVSRVTTNAADGFTINAGNETITLNPGGHMRIDLGAPLAKLVVFKGTAQVSDGSGTVMVGKNKTVTFDPNAKATPVFARNQGPAMFDGWDKNSADYHQQMSAFTQTAGSPYTYGANDLNYYGSFSDIGGCGTMWRPYLASAAWNPYGSGVWSYYPGAGYSWVSPYPWGWTPYHSGSWDFCPASGSWGWRPGGGWVGLNNAASLKTVPGRGHLISPPLPREGQGTLVAVNLKDMPVSRLDANGAFVFRNDSAGLGVPRGVFSHLNKVSQDVAQRGYVSRGVSDEQAERGMMQLNRGVSAGRESGGSVGLGSAGLAASASHASVGLSSGASHGGSAGSSSGASSGSGSSGGGHH